MSFDFGGDFVENTDAVDVSSDINVDPQSADYGSEQLTPDPANPGDQVGSEAGNSDFVNATDPAATQTAPVEPTAADPQATVPEQAGTPAPSAIDNAVSSATDTVASAADKAQNAISGVGDKIQAAASSTLTNLENKISSITIGSIVNSAVSTVEKLAVNAAVGAANQALSTVVGPAAASTLTNGAVNAFNAPPTNSATAVTPTTNPQVLANGGALAGTGGGDQYAAIPADPSVDSTAPQPTTTPTASATGPAAVPLSDAQQQAQDQENGANAGTGTATTTAPAADPNANQSDVAKLNADGSVNLSQFNTGPTSLPTNYTGEAVTLPADGNTVSNTSATAAPVADPNLATNPANPGAASINNTAGPVTGDPIAAFNTLNNLTGPTAAGLVNTALTTAAATAQGLIRQAQNQQTARLQSNTPAQTGDWRVRLSLAPTSNYLYNAPDPGPVLWPLYNTGGVIFPYTPTIDTSYKANYTPYDLTHSNYRGYFYQSSYVDGINVKGTFTAQDTAEANYLLAVIHFFRSVTKMFYGQDSQAGSPPPLVFLSGLGDFQFNQHPCVVSQFNYSLPGDVNYIRAQNVLNNGTNQLGARMRQTTLGNPIISNAIQRLASLGQGIQPGALSAPFAPQGSLPAGNPTYVPTKMDINITLLPIQSRSQVSQQFSLAGFANGNLLKGGFW